MESQCGLRLFQKLNCTNLLHGNFQVINMLLSLMHSFCHLLIFPSVALYQLFRFYVENFIFLSWYLRVFFLLFDWKCFLYIDHALYYMQKNLVCILRIWSGSSFALVIENILMAFEQIVQLILDIGRLLEGIELSLTTLVLLGWKRHLFFMRESLPREIGLIGWCMSTDWRAKNWLMLDSHRLYSFSYLVSSGFSWP